METLIHTLLLLIVLPPVLLLLALMVGQIFSALGYILRGGMDPFDVEDKHGRND